MKIQRAMVVAVVVGAALVAPAAQAAPSDAGSYLDQATGTMVVNVTTRAEAQRVRAGGSTAKIVKHSGATLRAATDELRRSATIPGTSWGVDPVTNQVRVTADSTVTGERLDRLRAAVAGLGDKARLESAPGVMRPFIAGGNPIHNGPWRCSLGFNVASADGTAYALTAGHCTNTGVDWTGSGGRFLGWRTGTSFPGNDYGIIRYIDGWDRPGGVYMYDGTVRDINAAADPYVGQSVERSGSTTGRHGGVVTGLNVTVNYEEGSVHGMIGTNVCAEPGDSGGSLFAGNTALGLTSGGSGDCRSGGQTFFQPVVEAMHNYGVWVY
ncbi:S1 family peptidase [Lentzea alba]|nr:S1 family peptidase [Lentzea alba]